MPRRLGILQFEYRGTAFTKKDGNYLSIYERVDGNWLLQRRIWNDPLPEQAPADSVSMLPAATGAPVCAQKKARHRSAGLSAAIGSVE